MGELLHAGGMNRARRRNEQTFLSSTVSFVGDNLILYVTEYSIR